MTDLVKIKDRDGLYRDMSSGAVINTNTAEYLNYMRKRNASNEVKNLTQQNTQEIKELKNDLAEIKQLLVALINKET